MINKQSMWLLTLLSLVLILGVYYVTMPTDLLKTNISSEEKEKDITVDVKEVYELLAMKTTREEKASERVEKLEGILTDETSSIEEKNTAFEDLKVLNLNLSKE